MLMKEKLIRFSVSFACYKITFLKQSDSIADRICYTKRIYFLSTQVQTTREKLKLIL